MRGVLIAILTLIVMGCNDYYTPDFDIELTPRTTPIASLRQQVGTSSGDVIEKDIVVQGRVTSSDKEGNFYHSIIVEDETGAMEVLIDLYNISTYYPEGMLLSLHLKGCATDYRYGILRAGGETQPYDYYDIKEITSRLMIERVVESSLDIEPITPRSTTIAQLLPEECGRLIRIDNLQLRHSTSIDTLQGMTLDDATWQGYSLFFDEHGDSIAVYTNDRAHFAKSKIPTTPISITGILQHCSYNGGKECRHIKMRYSSDYETL